MAYSHDGIVDSSKIFLYVVVISIFNFIYKKNSIKLKNFKCVIIWFKLHVTIKNNLINVPDSYSNYLTTNISLDNALYCQCQSMEINFGAPPSTSTHVRTNLVKVLLANFSYPKSNLGFPHLASSLQNDVHSNEVVNFFSL